MKFYEKIMTRKIPIYI